VETNLSYSTAFIIGLLGGGHCIAMCGGIVNSLSFSLTAHQSTSRLALMQLLFNIGRISSYVGIALLLALLFSPLQKQFFEITWAARILAGVLLILMGLNLMGLSSSIRRLEQLGQFVWKPLSVLAKNILPAKQPHQAFLLGTIWGWLPCGMVYSVLSWSILQTHWQQSALLMLCFGLGTLPSMFATGYFSVSMKAMMQKTSIRRFAGGFIVLFGVWTSLGLFFGHQNTPESHLPMTPHSHSHSEH